MRRCDLPRSVHRFFPGCPRSLTAAYDSYCWNFLRLVLCSKTFLFCWLSSTDLWPLGNHLSEADTSLQDLSLRSEHVHLLILYLVAFLHLRFVFEIEEWEVADYCMEHCFYFVYLDRSSIDWECKNRQSSILFSSSLVIVVCSLLCQFYSTGHLIPANPLKVSSPSTNESSAYSQNSSSCCHIALFWWICHLESH